MSGPLFNRRHREDKRHAVPFSNRHAVPKDQIFNCRDGGKQVSYLISVEHEKKK